jgi:hypothetical protein
MLKIFHIDNSALDEWIAASLIFLFAYAAINKILDHQIFQEQLGLFPFIKTIAWLASWAIPFLELFASTLLFFPVRRRAGLFLALILFTCFTIYLLAMIESGYHLPCSCGGVLKWMSWKQHLIFNSCFILLVIMAIVFSNSKKRLFVK